MLHTIPKSTVIYFSVSKLNRPLWIRTIKTRWKRILF